MRLLSARLAEEFVLFLESCHGPTWNELASNLCSIYARSYEDPSFPYLANAASVVSIYATKNFNEFQRVAHRRYVSPSVKIALISYASTQIATDFLAEFEIGQVY
jgi:hypothetical protein